MFTDIFIYFVRDKKISNKVLAGIAGVCESYICNVLAGRLSMSRRRFEKIAYAFGWTLNCVYKPPLAHKLQ